MSKIALQGDASGTGTFTIASPNSNSNYTLNLPTATGTINTSGAVNEVPAGSASAPSIYPTGDTNTGIFFPAADTIAFTEGGAESMRIDSSGNVGIGVTPSAWSGFRALQIGGATSIWSTTSGAGSSFYSNNVYYNGSNRIRINAGYATEYIQDTSGGAHIWYNAASSTAGSTITFTQAMTLDASGNLGIGTNSPVAKLDVRGLIAGVNGYADGLILQNATSGSYNRFILGQSTSSGAYIYTDAPGGVATALPLTFWTSGTERARITSGGDLYVGTTANIGAGYRAAVVSAGNVIGSQSTTSTNLVFAGLNSSGTVTFSVTGAGAVSKASGTFCIDHPLPELEKTHHLVHSFIEGPKADLIYRGKVNLVGGVASINIDEAATMTNGTFVLLCRDVQCFTTNESDWTPVRGSVSGNILTIEAQDRSSTAMISWMVIGERQDKHMYETGWTDENGKPIVEPLKQL
jgi:hypothetical protein